MVSDIVGKLNILSTQNWPDKSREHGKKYNFGPLISLIILAP